MGFDHVPNLLGILASCLPHAQIPLKAPNSKGSKISVHAEPL